MENIEIINELSGFFKVFSDTTSVRILGALIEKETSVGNIANKISVSSSAVSHQLSYLRSTSLVKTRKDGQVIYYNKRSDKIKPNAKKSLDKLRSDGISNLVIYLVMMKK